MVLSVIIVNYNVRHFLEQCLYSLEAAMEGVNGEVIVLDNKSDDNSLPYLKPKFPGVQFISNASNEGFAKANNRALRQASGDFILFLNPDTLVPKDCLRACIDRLQSDAKAGALGIKMIDGTGRFLPESKRAFPSPATSFFKLTGLSALFPKSKVFARYHLGHLDNDADHEVDVLAGAFMMIKREVLEAVGCFDDTFFMYGEDIDLSYRIQKACWKNIYFAGSSIIHFKGESTKKGSLNYVRMFYKAMNVFVAKHYSSGKAGFFKFFIQLAIMGRALLSAFSRFIKWIGLPVMDVLICFGAMSAVAVFWRNYLKPGIVYPPGVMLAVLPLSALIFIAAAAVGGLYDRGYRPGRAFFAMLGAVVVCLAGYSLLDVDYRFSRGVILFGGLLAALAILLFRSILLATGLLYSNSEKNEYRQTLIVGDYDSYHAVKEMMKKAGRTERVLGRVGLMAGEEGTVGSFEDLRLLLRSVPAREIVFALSEKLPLRAAMDFMGTASHNIRYKFSYSKSESLVGSDSKETAGESLSGTEQYTIALPEKRRLKRLVDVFASLLLVLLFPVNVFIIRKPGGLLANIWAILLRRKTWVGYCTDAEHLPFLPPGVLSCNGLPAKILPPGGKALQKFDFWYAKDYDWLNDCRILSKNYRSLGHRPW